MKYYYEIFIFFNDEEKMQRHYETKDDAIKAMMQLIGSPIVYSAILGHYSDEYPTGYDVICIIRNKSDLRGREM